MHYTACIFLSLAILLNSCSASLYNFENDIACGSNHILTTDILSEKSKEALATSGLELSVPSGLIGATESDIERIYNLDSGQLLSISKNDDSQIQNSIFFVPSNGSRTQFVSTGKIKTVVEDFDDYLVLIDTTDRIYIEGVDIIGLLSASPHLGSGTLLRVNKSSDFFNTRINRTDFAYSVESLTVNSDRSIVIASTAGPVYIKNDILYRDATISGIIDDDNEDMRFDHISTITNIYTNYNDDVIITGKQRMVTDGGRTFHPVYRIYDDLPNSFSSEFSFGTPACSKPTK